MVLRIQEISTNFDAFRCILTAYRVIYLPIGQPVAAGGGVAEVGLESSSNIGNLSLLPLSI